MNHDEATRYFDALGESVSVGRPSTAALIGQGRAAQRRRTRNLLTLSAASVALVLGGTAVVQQAIAGDPSKPSGSPTADPTEAPTSQAPVAPPGQRLVGSGRLVVAVPESWGGDHECEGFVIAPPGACGAASRIEGMVRIFELDSAEAQDVRLKSPQSTTRNGVVVTEGFPFCPPTASCAAAYYVLAPEANVGFALAGPAAVGALKASIVESLQLLPEGYTTVPFLPTDLANGPAGNLLVAAGLEVEESPPLEVGSGRRPQYGTTPEAGSVVAVGSTVTLLLEPGAGLSNGDEVEEEPDPGRIQTKLVGMGQVVVSVPASWISKLNGCGDFISGDILVHAPGPRTGSSCSPNAACIYPYGTVVEVPDAGVLFLISNGDRNDEQVGKIIDSLQLLDPEHAVSSADIDGEWQVISMSAFDALGAAQPSDETLAPVGLVMTFTEDTWRASPGGCYFMGGGYSLDRALYLHRDPINSSGSACPDGPLKSELTNLANLMLRIRSASLDGDVLTLRTQHSRTVMALERQE